MTFFLFFSGKNSIGDQVTKTRLQTLFWEIKNRFFYILVSFFLSFIVSYYYSTSLLYLFVLSYKTNKVSFDLKELFVYKQINDSAFIIAEKSKEKIAQSVLKQIGFDGLQTIEDENSTTICLQTNTNLSQKVLDNSLDSVLTNVSLRCDRSSDFSLSTLVDFYKQLKNIDITSISFIFTDVEEAFSSTILVCFIFSFLVIVPILVYEIFVFFVPSLYFFEKQKWLLQISIIILVWYFFIYNVQKGLIPKLAEFLLKFQISSFGFSVIGQIKIYTYCVWAITIFITTTLIFWLFYLALFCVISQKIEIESITQRRKMFRAIILLLSALIAPPEVQLFLAIIALFFFELAVYYFFFYKNYYKKKVLFK